MDLQKEREAFENWWESFHNGRQISCDYVEEDNSYSVGYANAQWVAWQAAVSQAVPEENALLSATLDAVQKLGSGDFILVPVIDIESALLEQFGPVHPAVLESQEQSHD